MLMHLLESQELTTNNSMKNNKGSFNICFLERSNDFRRDSNNEFVLTMVNESSVFELLRFDCINGNGYTFRGYNSV